MKIYSINYFSDTCKNKFLNKNQTKDNPITRDYAQNKQENQLYVRIWLPQRLLLCRIGIQNRIVVIRELFDRITTFCHPFGFLINNIFSA